MHTLVSDSARLPGPVFRNFRFHCRSKLRSIGCTHLCTIGHYHRFLIPTTQHTATFFENRDQSFLRGPIQKFATDRFLNRGQRYAGSNTTRNDPREIGPNKVRGQRKRLRDALRQRKLHPSHPLSHPVCERDKLRPRYRCSTNNRRSNPTARKSRPIGHNPIQKTDTSHDKTFLLCLLVWTPPRKADTDAPAKRAGFACIARSPASSNYVWSRQRAEPSSSQTSTVACWAFLRTPRNANARAQRLPRRSRLLDP